MTRCMNLNEWLGELLGSSQDALHIRALPEGALLLMRRADESELVIESESARAGNVGERPRILMAEDPDAEHPGEWFEILPCDVTRAALLRALDRGFEFHMLRRNDVDREKSLRRRDYELRELIEIGKSLNTFKDLDVLLITILEKARHLIGADAGSIYVIEGDADDVTERTLRFKFSQNDSIDYPSQEFVLPVSATSIAGAAVVMKRSIDIPDVRVIPEDAPYRFDASWDLRTGYQTISVLAVPMINQEGEVMGVVQLINKKQNPSVRLLTPRDFETEVVPMDARGRTLVETLASQAGIAMENTRLYAEIQRIFEGFIKASVHAIEQRDPTTSGHSFRVALLTRKLAEAVNQHDSGKYADTQFGEAELREIETAGLLHDFGKVGVREEVLLKAKKLYPPNLRIIRSRIDFIRTSIENDHLQRRLLMMEVGAPTEELAILDQARTRAVEDLDECWRIINSANEPTILSSGDFAKVEDVAARTYFDLNGKRRPYLEASELDALLVAKGSLTPDELEEIRSHAAHTISFLERIPWGRSMKNIPRYAGCHHEKLNGTGYPRQLTDKDIPLPAKMMAICDIYDALTASDRPYKKAVSLEKALQILDYEARDNHIDGELLEIFKTYKVYQELDKATAPEFHPGVSGHE